MHTDSLPSVATEGGGPCRLIRLPACLGLVGLGRSAWLDLVRDGKAPKPVKIGRATLWLESEVQQFIADRVRHHRGV
ncbi:MAG: AlpA family phage regulatory protein [Burkholderiaceae bacterium]